MMQVTRATSSTALGSLNPPATLSEVVGFKQPTLEPKPQGLTKSMKKQGNDSITREVRFSKTPKDVGAKKMFVTDPSRGEFPPNPYACRQM